MASPPQTIFQRVTFGLCTASVLLPVLGSIAAYSPLSPDWSRSRPGIWVLVGGSLIVSAWPISAGALALICLDYRVNRESSRLRFWALPVGLVFFVLTGLLWLATHSNV